MTTSSGGDLPRNLEFLYDKNRLNVAVSRAKCLAVVLAGPALLHVDCNTTAQMALVNTLCWVKNYAEGYRRIQPDLAHRTACNLCHIKDKWDLFTIFAPVPGAHQSLEVIAPTKEENNCTMPA